ncbi:ATP synthase subunit I [Cycloclasticus sp. 44_32_T64]|nr:ATP synthase subunit I [Cycloclasticus sp. 44_32_T64]
MRAQTLVVGYQIALVLMVATATTIFYSEQHNFKAILYGGFISVMTSIVMAFRLNQAVKKVQQGNQRGSLYIYLGVIERLFVAVALFSLGFMWLELSMLYTVVGLIAGQVGFMIGGFRVKE